MVCIETFDTVISAKFLMVILFQCARLCYEKIFSVVYSIDVIQFANRCTLKLLFGRIEWTTLLYVLHIRQLIHLHGFPFDSFPFYKEYRQQVKDYRIVHAYKFTNRIISMEKEEKKREFLLLGELQFVYGSFTVIFINGYASLCYCDLL